MASATPSRNVPSTVRNNNRYPEEGDRDMTYVPHLQLTALLLAVLSTFLMVSVGMVLLFFPQFPLRLIVNAGDLLLPLPNDNLQQILESIIRIGGGLLSSQALACILLLYPMVSSFHSIGEGREKSYLQLWNLRTSIAVQCVTGLVVIAVGLLNDRSGSTSTGTFQKVTFSLLAFGFTVLVLAFFSAMLSFWPAAALPFVVGMAAENNSTGTVASVAATRTRRATFENDDHTPESLREPLMPTRSTQESDDDPIEDEGNWGFEGDQERSEEDTAVAVSDTEGSQEFESTSRICGTRRLLALAAPQVIYLYIGCITLLIRMPFSLAIPHFISTTLGVLSRGEFDQARREIVWLFVLGTVDAW